jgi:hypothetical protein
MALILVDTQTVHEIDISGTTFKVKAADGRQYLQLLRIMTAGVMVADQAVTLTKGAWDTALEILNDRVTEIADHPDKAKTIEGMTGMDISYLAAEIMRLSRPSEDEVKN